MIGSNVFFPPDRDIRGQKGGPRKPPGSSRPASAIVAGVPVARKRSAIKVGAVLEDRMSLFEENAEILKSMEEDGSDLAPSRRVDFSQVFPSRASAESFASAAMKAGFKTAIEKVDRSEDPWDVTASKEMVPSAENVTAAEEKLDALAQASDGRSDGWGFMRV